MQYFLTTPTTGVQPPRGQCLIALDDDLRYRRLEHDSGHWIYDPYVSRRINDDAMPVDEEIAAKYARSLGASLL